MPRPREYDRTQVLEKAMNVFWSRGYEGAHLSDLTGATGLSKSSLYGAFGSKRELYLAVLDHYSYGRAALGPAGIIASHDCPVAGIRAVFDRFIESMMSGNDARGCFINSCAGETAPGDSEVTDRLAAAFAGVETEFASAIAGGQAQGRIATDKDALKLARFLTSSLQGLIVRGRANPEREVLEDIADVAVSLLE